jgi:DNA (cytosine-5)-methyltransferase 1
LFAEQVARSADWQRLVYRDLEALGYAVGCIPMEAASVGANHLRDRFWLVANANRDGEHAGAVDAEVAKPSEPVPHALGSELRDQPRRWDGANGSGAPIVEHAGEAVADANQQAGRRATRNADAGARGETIRERPAESGRRGGVVADPDTSGLPLWDQLELLEQFKAPIGDGWWDVEPDVGRVAHGVPARVAKLRALGNAIVPQVAAEFIKAAL